MGLLASCKYQKQTKAAESLVEQYLWAVYISYNDRIKYPLILLW